MAIRTEVEINTVVRLVAGKPCKDCEDSGAGASSLNERRSSGNLTAQDRVSLSAEGRKAAESGESGDASETSGERPVRGTGQTDAAGQQLDQQELKQIEQLRARDREVRSHEQAHKAAAGPYAVGGPTFEYTTGPDGKRYAVGGEVQIDTSPVPDNPEATIRKAQTIRRAALAPAEPSSQDRAVAAKATSLETRARAEIQKEQRAENQERTERAAEKREETKESEGTDTPDDTTTSTASSGSSADSNSASGSPEGGEANPNIPNPRRQSGQFDGSPSVETGQLLNLIA